jgi:L-lactate dehydrogenase complex protein LldE
MKFGEFKLLSYCVVNNTIQLFVTCIIDTLYPNTGESVVRVLRRAGLDVQFPMGQTCCGQPAYNAGMRPQARQMAEHTIQVLEGSSGDIIIPSGSCTGMIRHGYLELFASDSEWLSRAKSIADRTYEFTQYLVDVLAIDDLGARYPGKITYHPSCHLLRDLGVDQQARRLLESVDEVEIAPLPKSEECCGFGGLFSIEHPELSKAMLDRKIENLVSSGAPVLVSCDAGCVAHISGGLHRRGLSQRAVHIADVLDESQSP